MVQAYASLETFLRDRTQEVMSHVSAGSATFATLPTGLQEMAIFGALDGLRFRTQMLGSDPQARSLVQSETEVIASTNRVPYGFSKMMFGYDRSNVSPSSIKDLLEAVGVGGDPWHHLTRISARVGLGGLPLKDGLTNGYKRRNKSAHDAENQVTGQQIEDFLRDSLATAIGFDALFSTAGRMLHEGNTVQLGSSRRLLETDVRFRFLDPDKVGWREVKEGVAIAKKLHKQAEPDLPACLARARPTHEVVVQRDARSWPTNWITTDCP